MKRILLTCLLLAGVPGTCQAHFLWLLTGGEHTGRVHVYFGEAAEPDDPDLLDRVLKATVWSTGRRGEPQLLTVKKGNESLEAELPARSQQNPVILRHTYGIFTRGDSSFLLNYYAKCYPFALPGTWREINDTERLPLEIVPSRDGKSTVLQVAWKGKPASGCQVVVVGPGIDDKLEGTSDEAGNYRCVLPGRGTYSIRARLIENKPGKYEGKDYKASRHYSTLTLHNVPSKLEPSKHCLPELPQGITSFGGAIAGDTVYAYGGNYGSAHTYSTAGQSNDLWALNLAEPKKWQKISTGPKLQGLALVQHNGLLYRLGGFTAMNGEDEPQDLRSQASVGVFDPSTRKWADLPLLPEPRSSFDAAVLGDTLYVAGGWNMPGKEKEKIWHQTAWAMNLASAEKKWTAVAKLPFTRRALTLAAWDSRLYCIGGMRQQGGPTTRVDVYDPKTDSWQQGPSLLGTSMDGFGSSAFACAGDLYVSTISGSLQRLSKDGKKWEFVGVNGGQKT